MFNSFQFNTTGFNSTLFIAIGSFAIKVYLGKSPEVLFNRPRVGTKPSFVSAKSTYGRPRVDINKRC